MDWFTAADTFVATLDNGGEELVPKGKTYPGTHELVKRDLAAQKENANRTPLFRHLDMGEEEPPKSEAPKADTPAEPAPAEVKPAQPETKGAASPSRSAPKPGPRPAAKGRS